MAAGGAPLAPWRVTGSTTRVAEIAERVATATLFGGGALVVVEDPSPLLRARADRDALLATLGAVAPGNALVFLEPTDGSGRRAKSLEELAAAVSAIGGQVRQLVAPREGALARWIRDRAGERRIAIEPAAADLLARRVGGFVREGDIERRRQGQLAIAELEKLALYRLDAPIRREDVEALVADAIPGSTWALLDAVGSRRTREAADLLDRVLEVKPEPVVLTFLHRRIRDLIAVLDAQLRGEHGPGSGAGDEAEGVPGQEAVGPGARLAPRRARRGARRPPPAGRDAQGRGRRGFAPSAPGIPPVGRGARRALRAATPFAGRPRPFAGARRRARAAPPTGTLDQRVSRRWTRPAPGARGRSRSRRRSGRARGRASSISSGSM